MKILSLSAVLFIALFSDGHSIKVNSDNNNKKVNPHQTGTIPSSNANYGTSYMDGLSGKTHQYYPQQSQQPHPNQINQMSVQQQPYLNQQYSQYYPQHQYHTYATDKTFGVGGGVVQDGGQDEGVFGGLTSMFSGIFDMLFGLSGHDEMSSDGTMLSQGYGVPVNGMGWDSGMGGGVGGAGGLGGIGGFIKGKKAGWLARGAVGLLLSPVILPIIILWIALIVLIIWFIPIPVIDVNGNNDGNGKKRSFSSQLYSPIAESMQLAKSVLQSGECVERLACEIASLSKNYVKQQDWLQRKMDGYNSNKWVHRVSRSFKTARAESDCKRFSCSPYRKFRSFFSTSYETSLAKNNAKPVKSNSDKIQ